MCEAPNFLNSCTALLVISLNFPFSFVVKYRKYRFWHFDC
jgi:hypothetical protein